MAFKRRSFNRRRPRRAARRRYKRRLRSNTMLASMQFKGLDSCVVGAGNSGSKALMINYPFYQYTSGGAFATLAYTNSSYVRALDFYGFYRVKGIRIRYIPRYTQALVADAGPPAFNLITVDQVHVNIPDTLNEGLNDPAARMFNSTKSYKLYVKNTTRGWFHTGAAPNVAPSTLGLQTPPNPLGSIGLFFSSQSASTTAGDLDITYYVQFKGVDTSQT